MNYQIGAVGAGIMAVYSVLVLLIIVWPLMKLLRNFSWKWIVVAPSRLRTKGVSIALFPSHHATSPTH